MNDERVCRRCSVKNVNALCRLYDEGFRDNDDNSKDILKTLVQIARERGYPEGGKVLLPGLTPGYVRRICWNISSLLKDQDFLRNGVSFDG